MSQDSEQAPLLSIAPEDSPIQLIVKPGNRSILDVGFNLANATVGAGIIGLPYAINESGFGMGILLAFIVAVLTFASLNLMVLAGRCSHQYKYIFDSMANMQVCRSCRD